MVRFLSYPNGRDTGCVLGASGDDTVGASGHWTGPARGSWVTVTVNPPDPVPIVTVPERVLVSVLASTVTVMSPTDTLDGVVIHVRSSLTGQLQPLWPATRTFRVPADDVNVNGVGVTPVGESEQSGRSWMTVTIRLAPNLTVPVRRGPSFRSTPIAKLPGDAGGTTLIQVSLALTGQLQPVSPATVTFRLPAADVNVNLVGVTPVGESEQSGRSWMTVTIRLAPNLTVPVRSAPVSFSSSAVNVTSASPATGEGAAPSHVRFSLTS